jgi:hypothetical protein
LQAFPKNLARQHLGSNLFVFNPSNQTYVPNEAAAAWLDEDVSTGWPALAGKQHYLLALPEPELITNFALSCRQTEGTVTLYAGDEPAAPGARSWAPIARDIPLESINDKKLSRSFSKLAKYLLIETNIPNPGPVYSLYVYGEKPAISYRLRQREEPIEVRSIFGPYTNTQTSFNTGGLHSQSRVSYADSSDGYVGWQRAIDDNPETALSIAPSGEESGAVLRYNQSRRVSRVAVLTEPTAKGKLDFYALNEASPEPVVAQDASLEPAASTAAAASQTPVSVSGMTPTVSIVLDGTNPRTSIDFDPVEASSLLVRWTPANGTDPVALRELDTFDGLTLANYETGLKADAVAQYTPETNETGAGRDNKDYKDFKDAKDIAEGPNDRRPYLPGSLGFPPNLTVRRGVPPPRKPEELSH